MMKCTMLNLEKTIKPYSIKRAKSKVIHGCLIRNIEHGHFSKLHFKVQNTLSYILSRAVLAIPYQ